MHHAGTTGCSLASDDGHLSTSPRLRLAVSQANQVLREWLAVLGPQVLAPQVSTFLKLEMLYGINWPLHVLPLWPAYLTDAVFLTGVSGTVGASSTFLHWN